MLRIFVSRNGNILSKDKQEKLEFNQGKDLGKRVGIVNVNNKRQISLNPKTIKAWFEPAIIDKKRDTDLKSKKNKKFGSDKKFGQMTRFQL